MSLTGKTPVRVLHVSTGLGTGGAEMMLLKLLGAMPREHWASWVISLRDVGSVGPRIAALGIPVTAAGFGRGVRSWGAPGRLRRAVAQAAPDLLQGWMYHGNLAALLARPKGAPVLWNVRQSLTDFARERRLTALLIRAGARLSSRPARIVYNSRASARQHEAIGYDPARTVVIPNGFDTTRFQPAPAARAALRARLGLAPDAVVVGQVARLHPMKNHLGFLRVASRIAAARPETAFVLAGTGVQPDDPELSVALAGLGLRGRAHLLGAVEDTPGLMAGLDLLCSPSLWGEGFPNVIGEALASGVPCVVTDVGDSAWVVGPAGAVVPPGDEAALSAALLQLIEAPAARRAELGRLGRRRVESEFAISAVVSQYVALYRAVLDGRPPQT